MFEGLFKSFRDLLFAVKAIITICSYRKYKRSLIDVEICTKWGKMPKITLIGWKCGHLLLQRLETISISFAPDVSAKLKTNDFKQTNWFVHHDSQIFLSKKFVSNAVKFFRCLHAANRNWNNTIRNIISAFVFDESLKHFNRSNSWRSFMTATMPRRQFAKSCFQFFFPAFCFYLWAKNLSSIENVRTHKQLPC